MQFCFNLSLELSTMREQGGNRILKFIVYFFSVNNLCLAMPTTINKSVSVPEYS